MLCTSAPKPAFLKFFWTVIGATIPTSFLPNPFPSFQPMDSNNFLPMLLASIGVSAVAISVTVSVRIKWVLKYYNIKIT